MLCQTVREMCELDSSQILCGWKPHLNQSRTARRSWGYFSNILCFGSLKCWKLNHCPIIRSHALWERFSLSTSVWDYIYLFFSSGQPPCASAEKRCHTTMLRLEDGASPGDTWCLVFGKKSLWSFTHIQLCVFPVQMLIFPYALTLRLSQTLTTVSM